MEFSVEKYVSNFVQSQFPQFYQEEGADFILFLKAYYEWMEENGNPIYQSRRLFDYRDIDNTLEKFLEYFQKKYLYGIPFSVIANKRFLLKHILDVYRSKSTIQCYRLLFKLLYNEDIQVYLPGRDVLRASDGTWMQPRYIEVTDNDVLESFIGKTIIGSSSRTTAVVESFVKESYNNDIINIIYLSNILPKGGDFKVGEKITLPEQLNDPVISIAAPTVLGSLNTLTIINGGQGFSVGDTIKIYHKDANNNILSYGIDGLLRVSKLSRGAGTLNFSIIKSGFGFTSNSLNFVYKNGANGQNASFTIGAISSTQTLNYNTDLVCDYANLTLNSTTYGFPNSPSGNLTTNIGTVLSTTNQIFGSILNLTNIKTGNGYTQPANVFVRSTLLSDPLIGTVSYNTSSNTVTGTATIFDYIFANNDVIALQADGAFTSTIEYAVIKEVVSNTVLTLYGPPSLNSTGTAVYRAAPTILPSQYALYESPMISSDGSINGENEFIKALPSTGNNVISEVTIVNSGKGYSEGEEVRAYLYGAVSNVVTVFNGGSNYTNGDVVVFAGGNPGTTARGYVSTFSNGTIANVTVTFAGSGYEVLPTLSVVSNNGTDAVLIPSLTEYNFTSEIIGKVAKTGLGRGKGYWSTTRGFLNADKYLQDSYYYQDYSYEIGVAKTLNKYKDILYNTFHVSGSELFGRYLLNVFETQKTSLKVESSLIYYDNWTVDSGNTIGFLASTTGTTADSTTVKTDVTSIAYTGYLSADSTTIKADNRKFIEYIYASSTNISADNNKLRVSRYYI